PLFTDAQKQQDQPKQVASAIQTMTKSVGVASTASSGKQATWSLQATSGTAKYIPYKDLPGSRYSAVNTAADRSVTVTQPTGLSYSRDSGGTQPPSFTTHTPAQATVAIDALDGKDWHTSQYATPGVLAAAQSGTLHLGSWWGDFWGWVKKTAVTITHVIVSVAEDVYAGIRFIVDGAAHVFKAIINGIDEAVSAIGAFFIELGHLIEEVIEALSVLFHFEEIIKTQTILKNELQRRMDQVPTLVNGTVKPRVDAFFARGEQAIAAALNGAADKLAGSAGGSGPPVTALKGSGSTAHTAFSVTPKSGGSPASTSTQSTWGLQNLQRGVGTSPSGLSATGAGSGGDPVSDFFSSFTARLSGDGNLSAQWAKVQSGGQGLGHATSVTDVLEQGLATLLRTLALLLDGALAVGNALLDGLLGLIASLWSELFDAHSGLLNQAIDIPVLSWLFHELTGEPLTFINALLFVVAIPVTVVWRIAEGQWPSQSVRSVSDAASGDLGAADPFLARLLGFAGAFTTIVVGFISAAGDAMGEADVPLFLGRAALAGSIIASMCGLPNATSDTPSDLAWDAWGIGLGVGLLNILGSMSFSSGIAGVLTYMGPFMLMVLNIALAAVVVSQIENEWPSDPVSAAGLVIGVFATLPGFVNFIKLSNELGALIVAGLDVAMGFASGGIQFAEALA
ncbi:MAG: hypothetical protein JOZ81_08475, partial [Chloroflexi bacterium]|nr:hypothetical protein [Chloroflexota bacterium]